MHVLKQGAMNPTININIVCTLEQLELVGESVNELQQSLYSMGVGSSVTTTRPPGNPPIDLAEALRHPDAFVSGFEEVERGMVHPPEPEP
jgi:hypothetical protein